MRVNTHFIMKKLLLIVLLIGIQVSALAQDSKIDDLIYRGENLFKIKNYDDALASLKEAVELGANDAYVHYMMGVSLMMQPNSSDQIKAVNSFEMVAKAGFPSEVPSDVHYYMGLAYHKNMQVDKAITQYEKFLDVSGTKPELRSKAELELRKANNAVAILNQKKDINIQRMAPPINSEYTEYNPVVSADQSVMAFTSLRPDARSGRSAEEIYITYREQGNWNEPTKIKVDTRSNVGTAGISPDGQQMLLFIGGERNTGNIYSMNKKGSNWETPAIIRGLNSNYLESTASITPDGKTMYFASNRPDGYGGFDIYSAQKDDRGIWGNVKNLGPEVNTKYDEDAPFIHPDMKTLYFTSNGENSMGGRDIFKTVKVGSEWKTPENMGYPINTTHDDNYFTLTADGSTGFFSSDRPGGYGGQDIYVFDMPEQYANIPLTMLKGKVTAGDEHQPVPTKIKVIDNENNTKVDYVYDPDPETGNYLIILPPGKNYDLIIESEGYLPYTLNINVPNQTYFYELYQKINLNLIKQFDVVVGQEVTVNNAFFDTKQNDEISPRQANEAMLVQNDSLDVYDMMDAIIAAEDTAAFDYLLDLLYKVNPIENVDFSSNQEDMEIASRTYYYDESDTTTLKSRTVEGETIFSLPTMYVTEEAKKQKEKKKESAITYDPSILEPVYKFYFDAGKSNLDDKYKAQLQEVLDHLKKHDALGIQILGYASSEGDPELNRKLSNDRAIEVLNFFNFQGIVRRRIIAKGYGATKSESSNPAENRRVEVQLVDLNKVDE
jgi:outer membrane protein OmpA-like peptidoglycan-associated protein/tetratricopeptide (TPR) repeat protein